MKYTRRDFRAGDYIRIRDFLKMTYHTMPTQFNWLIDRWNFCRYFAQPIYQTFASWPETVGIWVDENGSIVSVANSEGENRGEAFFQFGINQYPDGLLDEMIAFSEKTLCASEEGVKSLSIRLNEDQQGIIEKLKIRDYVLADWKETTCSVDLTANHVGKLPGGFRIADANEVSLEKRVVAHAHAFHSDDPENAEWNMQRESAYRSLRTAPDYRPKLDLAAVDADGEIASFATVWYDEQNQIGILEPVGTIPKYRRLGLGKAVIYAGADRIKALGARKLYVGSDQQFYRAIGFSVAFQKVIWHRQWRES